MNFDKPEFHFCPKCRVTGTIICTDGTRVACNSISAGRHAVHKLVGFDRLEAAEAPELIRQIEGSGLPPHAIYDVALGVGFTPDRKIDMYPLDEIPKRARATPLH